MNKIYTAAIALMAAGAVHAQSTGVLSPHTAMAMKSQAQSRAADDHTVAAYITVDTSTVDADVLRRMGISVGIDLGSTLTAMLTPQQIQQLGEMDGIEYIQVSTPAEQMLDVASAEVGIDRVHRGTGVDMPYTGAGVVVGIVDKGFDYKHPAFYGPDGQLRISRVWEQNSAPSGGLHAPFGHSYGIELTTAAEIENSEGDVWGSSHGTHVASIAAGSDAYLDGALQGMAPDAEIVLVSMLDDGGGNVTISDAIDYIFDYAESVGKPCVVNLSLGAHHGPHDGTSTFDVIADKLQGPGRLIVGAAGNHRAGKFHVRHTFVGRDNTPLRTFIDYKTSLSARNSGGEIDIWADQAIGMEMALVVYRTATGAVAERAVVYPCLKHTLTEVTLGRNVTGHIDVVAETSPLNGKVHVLLTSNVTALRNGYAIAIEVTPRAGGTIDIWGDNIKTGLTSLDMEGFTGPTDESTICEIGGTARRILTVGAYTTRSEFTRMGETATVKIDETDGALSSFSSCGPTADGRMKPQVAAPGCMISAAVSNFDNSGTLIYSQYYKDGDGRDNFYGYMQGTSMSSPMVAGIVATWLQAWPEMTPEDLVEVIRATSRTDEHTGTLADGDNDWGYGKVDALAGLKQCIQNKALSGVDAVAADAGTPVRLLGVSGLHATLLMTAACSDVMAHIYTVTGAEVGTVGIGAAEPSQTVNLALPAPGAYIIAVTADGARTALKVIATD